MGFAWKQGLTGLALLFAVCVGARAQKATPKIDVDKLIHSAQLTGATTSKQIFDYSWKSKTHVREYKRARLTKDVEQDHEVYPAPGLTYVAQRLVRENGLPLSAKRAAKEQKRLSEELERAELEQGIFVGIAAVSPNETGCPAFGIWTVLNGTGGTETSFGVSDFLCFEDYSLVRVEPRNGRESAVILFRPLEGMKLAKEKTPFAKLAGLMWIDVADKAVSHIEAWPVSAATSIKKAAQLPAGPASIVFDEMRLPNGMWVRRSRYIDTRSDPSAFNGLNLEWTQEFDGYQRYFSELKDYKVSEPNSESKPPEH